MKTKRKPQADMETLMPLLIGVWRRFRKLAGPADVLQTREFRSVVAAILELKKWLETGNEFIGKDYLSDPDLLGAYLLYFWVVHYQQGLSLINELPCSPGRTLDLASGPGAFSFAALRHDAREVIAIDRNATALQLAGEICGRHGYPLTVRCHNILKFPLPVEGTFDLIIIGHCLEELFPNTKKGWKDAQRAWIQQLLPLLSSKGYFLFVESSLLPSNHRLLELRDTLVRDGFPVQAPCVWRAECPALHSKNPCYAQRDFEKPYVIKEIQRAAQINLGSLKMSYLLMGHIANAWPALQETPLYRVISPPFEAYTGKRYYLCGTDGKKDIGSHHREQTQTARAFDFLKRGDLISINNGLVNQNHIDIIEHTEVKIEAAVGKALPEIISKILPDQ